MTVYVKKSFKTKHKTINNLKNKIIQKSIQLILEEIYEHKENVFSKFSHGFRLNKNSHTAVKQIKTK
jgi:retron-type reverse transcriptase